jgi:hypothetical protein
MSCQTKHAITNEGFLWQQKKKKKDTNQTSLSSIYYYVLDNNNISLHKMNQPQLYTIAMDVIIRHSKHNVSKKQTLWFAIVYIYFTS